jgi:hypothetical protein
MRVPHGEGLAIHTGLESCVYTRKDMGEALTGGVRVRLLSRERRNPGCRRCYRKRKATRTTSLPRDVVGPRVVRDPVHVHKLIVREPGDPTVGLIKRSAL